MGLFIICITQSPPSNNISVFLQWFFMHLSANRYNLSAEISLHINISSFWSHAVVAVCEKLPCLQIDAHAFFKQYNRSWTSFLGSRAIRKLTQHTKGPYILSFKFKWKIKRKNVNIGVKISSCHFIVNVFFLCYIVDCGLSLHCSSICNSLWKSAL